VNVTDEQNSQHDMLAETTTTKPVSVLNVPNKPDTFVESVKTFQMTSQRAWWSSAVAELLVPSLLCLAKHDVYYANWLAKLAKQFHSQAFMGKLLSWYTSFDFDDLSMLHLHDSLPPGNPGFASQIKRLFQPEMLVQLTNQLAFWKQLCQTAARHDMAGFASLAETCRASQGVALPGWPDIVVVRLCVDSKDFRQASSCARPYILPCLVRRNNAYQRMNLLVKYCQNLAADALCQLLAQMVPGDDMLTYPVVCTSATSGIIVMVSQAVGVDHLDKTDWAASLAGNQTFVRSVAAQSALSMFVGLGDRIDSNMMVDQLSKRFFHIDFEYLLGKQPPLKESIRHAGNMVSSVLPRQASRTIQPNQHNQQNQHNRPNQPSQPSQPNQPRHPNQFNHFNHFNHVNQTNQPNCAVSSIQPVIPANIVRLMNGYKSQLFRCEFVPAFNQVFQHCWAIRHLFFYSTKCLCCVQSTTHAGRPSISQHASFYERLFGNIKRGQPVCAWQDQTEQTNKTTHTGQPGQPGQPGTPGQSGQTGRPGRASHFVSTSHLDEPDQPAWRVEAQTSNWTDYLLASISALTH
jgi:hypothetical protein